MQRREVSNEPASPTDRQSEGKETDRQPVVGRRKKKNDSNQRMGSNQKDGLSH